MSTEITPEQQAIWQTMIDKTQAEFSGAVSRGRAGKLKASIAALADGRVHLAADAQTLGLIDGIASFDTVMSQLREQIKPRMVAQVEAPVDPIALFESTVRMLVANEGLTGIDAAARVRRESPDLHRAYLEAVNARAGHKFAAARLTARRALAMPAGGPGDGGGRG